MESIARTNPWWFYENWDSRDRHIGEWSAQKYSWVPRWINSISLKPFSLNFVWGVRQLDESRQPHVIKYIF
jgi:predicted AAA+ superfamily ATPase